MNSLTVELSRRDSQQTYLIVVRHGDRELWRRFGSKGVDPTDDKINTAIAMQVFEALDSFIHTLELENKEPRLWVEPETIERMKKYKIPLNGKDIHEITWDDVIISMLDKLGVEK